MSDRSTTRRRRPAPRPEPPRDPATAVHLDRPTVLTLRPDRPEWGSDVVAEMLRRLGVEYVALNPGASFRGLHDSLVNYNGNERPGVIVCNHEEVAVAIAHGYAKVTGRPMAVTLHSTVGLMHGTIGIFDAWVDRAPMLVLGGTGPLDATRRRPWIDWIHTAHVQGQLVREYTKWEHQPASVAAIPEAMLRAWHAALTEPCGPVYLCFDAGLQEARLDPGQPLAIPDPRRYPLPDPVEPAAAAVEEAARWLVEAHYPVLLLGRTAPTEEAWRDLRALAELLGAAVLADAKSPACFPTDHPLHQGGPTFQPGAEEVEVLRRADLVLALDRIDPAGTLRAALGPPPAGSDDGQPWPRLINVSLEPYALRSWAADYQELPPADLPILASVPRTVARLVEAVQGRLRDDPAARQRVEARFAEHRVRRARLAARWAALREASWDRRPIDLRRAVAELRTALGERSAETILARVPLSWPTGVWDFTRPGSYVGYDGGASIGSGPGIAVGAALAARPSGRPVLAIVGDGDLLMAPTALWTAAHHRLPVLFVVANNQSYLNDEQHQERVAQERGRPVENRWVGQRMDEPPVDFAALARSLGVEGLGPVAEPENLAQSYRAALAALDEGRPALVDVRIAPR